ncbi:hypothetical protein EJB05_46413, partial [Eragrostis curvula]
MAASTSSPPLPCLVFDNGNTQPATAFCVSDGAHRAFDAKELRGKRSWSTSSGWVLVWDPATTATFLWNPSSPADRFALPPLAHPPAAGSACALSGRPTDAGAGGCTVVLVDSAALWYLLPGAAAWARHDYDIGSVTARFPNGESYSSKRTVSRLAPCRGRFYYARSSTELGVVDFSTAAAGNTPPAFSVVPVNVPLRVPDEVGSWMEAFVYELDIDGDLHMAYVIYHGPDTDNVADVAIYRVDFDACNESVRVDSIGDRAVLAGNRFAGWCPATQFGLVPNSVYWMSPVDKRLHVFDIGARTEKLVQDPYNQWRSQHSGEG